MKLRNYATIQKFLAKFQNDITSPQLYKREYPSKLYPHTWSKKILLWKSGLHFRFQLKPILTTFEAIISANAKPNAKRV
jgi:hypothetical protein